MKGQQKGSERTVNDSQRTVKNSLPDLSINESKASDRSSALRTYTASFWMPCSEPGGISMLLLEWLRNACNHPAHRSSRSSFARAHSAAASASAWPGQQQFCQCAAQQCPRPMSDRNKRRLQREESKECEERRESDERRER